MAKDDGTQLYSKVYLWFYDIIVLWFNTRFAWNCSTEDVLLLHCIPVLPEEKTRVFDVVRSRLHRDGVLVGTTILGRESPMNRIARWRMTMYNEGGV
ncbi:O-methyltransferase [Cladobotryum mycophilum]|uniref:O-methyltransferase n=1 Tax=Cladobotryum mycophilum TaxID=491253 RepID=A0ABR0STV2_9HYPO